MATGEESGASSPVASYAWPESAATESRNWEVLGASFWVVPRFNLISTAPVDMLLMSDLPLLVAARPSSATL